MNKSNYSLQLKLEVSKSKQAHGSNQELIASHSYLQFSIVRTTVLFTIDNYLLQLSMELL